MSDVLGLLDLIALSRRQVLSPSEQWRLDRAVEASATLQLVQEMSRDFAPFVQVRPGDDQIIDQAVALALASRERVQRKRSQRLPAALLLGAAAMLFGASTAFGYWGVRKVYPIRRPAEAQSLATSPVSPAHPKPDSRGSRNAAGVPVQEPSTTTGVTSGSPPPSPGAQRPATPPAALGVSGAATLFSQAKSARSAGRIAEAIQSFEELQRRFPQSYEAEVSHMSLGNLLLEQGDAGRALLQFIQVKGAHVQDGLVGQAEAYSKLGRHEDAKRIWRQLREQFPNSVGDAPVQGQEPILRALEPQE